MPRRTRDEYDAEEDAPARPGQLSANGHWIFGSVYAALALVGFAFGVWAGAARHKPDEVAEAKPAENAGTPGEKQQPPPVVTPPTPTPPEPMPLEPKPEPKPEPKAKEPKPEPEPKPKEPEPKPKAKEPESKKPTTKAVAFKEVETILKASCIDCHGAPGRKPGSGVDLRTVVAIMKGDKNGDPVVVKGEPEKSRLYLSIVEGAMPEPGSGKPVPTPEQLETIKNWILSGAKERRRTIRKREGRTTARRRLELTRAAGAG